MSDEAPGPSTAKRSRDEETPTKEPEEEVIYGQVKQTYGNLMRKRKLGMPIRPCEYDGVLSPYQAAIPPNFEMCKVERPPVVPLRFTYNGKMMIASTHQHQYVVYNYLGVGNAIGCSERNVFDKVFSVRFAVNLPDHQENRYSRDNMFILEDDDHFITATSYALPETSRLPANVTQRNSETIVTNGSHMETYVFYTVSLETGKITDKLEITFDLLNLHHCLYLRGRTFVVQSILHQTIHIYHIDRRTGKFLKEAEIGEYLEPPAERPFPLSNVHAVFTSWRQILMKKFYEYHKMHNAVPQFFESSPLYRTLKMTRVQLVSDTVLLIRLVPEDYVTCDRSAAHQQIVPFFFAFYDFVDMEMLAVYAATSPEMLDIYEKHWEAFKYAFLTKPQPPLTMWYREAVQFERNNLKSAFLSKLKDEKSKKKEAELARKVLAELPFTIPSCPSFTPFLDPGAFSFDKNIIPSLERQRVSSDMAIRTFSRITGKVHLNINLTHPDFRSEAQAPPCSLLFHPYDSFAIHFHKSLADVNFSFFVPNMEDPDRPQNIRAVETSPAVHLVEDDEPSMFPLNLSRLMGPNVRGIRTSWDTYVLQEASVSPTEMHVALIGMKNSGKSAIAVKYLTKRFLGEYSSDLEDTYCRQESINQMPLMVWLMDTVDSAERDPMRYLSWADVFVVIYDTTSRLSFQVAEQLLQQIASHEHSLCTRDHKTMLLGNKIDLERYRQVSESDGEKLAKKYSTKENIVLFAEMSATDIHARVVATLHKPIIELITDRANRRSPSPRLYSSDSEVQARRQKSGFMSLKNVARSGTLRRSKSPKQLKNKTGSKLLKLFHT